MLFEEFKKVSFRFSRSKREILAPEVVWYAIFGDPIEERETNNVCHGSCNDKRGSRLSALAGEIFIRLLDVHECPVLFLHSSLYSVRGRSLRHAWVETLNRYTHMLNHSNREGRRWFPERRRSMIVSGVCFQVVLKRCYKFNQSFPVEITGLIRITLCTFLAWEKWLRWYKCVGQYITRSLPIRFGILRSHRE